MKDKILDGLAVSILVVFFSFLLGLVLYGLWIFREARVAAIFIGGFCSVMWALIWLDRKNPYVGY